MVNSNHQTFVASDLGNKKKCGVNCMLIFAEVLTWHENYGQAGKKIAYFCHINSTSRNVNTALWSNCRLRTYRFSFYMQTLFDFTPWLVSCDVHFLVSAFEFTQTPETSREHSRPPCAHGLRVHCVPARAQPEYHCNAIAIWNTECNTHGKHLSTRIKRSVAELRNVLVSTM